VPSWCACRTRPRRSAFAAGAILTLLDQDERMTHPEFRRKLEAIGFGFFIPAFFVTTGGPRQTAIAGLLQATSLPFIVAATAIGLELGVIDAATSAALIAAGLLSVVIFPATGLALLRVTGSEVARLAHDDELPSPPDAHDEAPDARGADARARRSAGV